MDGCMMVHGLSEWQDLQVRFDADSWVSPSEPPDAGFGRLRPSGALQRWLARGSFALLWLDAASAGDLPLWRLLPCGGADVWSHHHGGNDREGNQLEKLTETLHERPACVDSVVDLLQMAGRLLGAVAVLLAVPVGLAALRLACVAAVEEEEESGSETAPLTSRRTMGPRVHADEDSL
ncbi:Uncharacterized protein (Fragment) [Durusdinium trenchii]|uniref:Uncharacterized protein n=1 Tax=Durusdinium trenchii TaxID=1381693 RepID=A0ABP0LXW1_9DINO